MSDSDKHNINRNKQPGKTYVSPRFEHGRGAERQASKVFDSTVDYRFNVEKDKVVLHETDGGRHVVEVRFFEANREIKGISIQKYTTSTGKSHPTASLSFWGDQIPRLIEFLLNVKRIHFTNSDKINITDTELRQILLSKDQLVRLAVEDQEALITLAHAKITKRDVVALAYRREQLAQFSNLLNDNRAILDYCYHHSIECKPEKGWQHFLKVNSWIFGFGLDYQYLGILEEEAEVGFADVAGKQAPILDFLMSSAEFTTLVELKRPDTPLFHPRQKRAGTWALHSQLTDSVSQILEQKAAWTIKANTNVGGTYARDGSRINQRAVDPKCILLIGSESSFDGKDQEQELKRRTFELYRRDSRNIDILTFSELYRRAQFIVGHSESSSSEANTGPIAPNDEEIPF